VLRVAYLPPECLPVCRVAIKLFYALLRPMSVLNFTKAEIVTLSNG
jgi:hypothetical protein